MEMLHKHPESGDILNLQDAKFFSGNKKPLNYYIWHRAIFFLEYLDMENFKQMNL